MKAIQVLTCFFNAYIKEKLLFSFYSEMAVQFISKGLEKVYFLYQQHFSSQNYLVVVYSKQREKDKTKNKIIIHRQEFKKKVSENNM